MEYERWNGKLEKCQLFGNIEKNRVNKRVCLSFRDDEHVHDIRLGYVDEKKFIDIRFIVNREKLEQVAEVFGL